MCGLNYQKKKKSPRNENEKKNYKNFSAGPLPYTYYASNIR